MEEHTTGAIVARQTKLTGKHTIKTLLILWLLIEDTNAVIVHKTSSKDVFRIFLQQFYKLMISTSRPHPTDGAFIPVDISKTKITTGDTTGVLDLSPRSRSVMINFFCVPLDGIGCSCFLFSLAKVCLSCTYNSVSNHKRKVCWIQSSAGETLSAMTLDAEYTYMLSTTRDLEDLQWEKIVMHL